MPLPKLIRTAAVFALAFLFGIGVVGAIHFLSGFITQTIPVERQEKANPEPIGFGSGTDESEKAVSMNDAGFTPPQVDQQDPAAFDPEGIYTATGSTPPGFHDLQAFVINNKILDVDCDDKDFGKLVKPTGFVFVGKNPLNGGSGVRFEFQKIDISMGRIEFATNQVGETSYEFSGEFLYKGNFYTLDPEAKVVTGTLAKFVNGKKVAETRIGFTWSIDLDCVC